MNPDIASWYAHAIARPFIDVCRRSADDVAFRPKFNDLSIAVGKVCTACFHLPERLEEADAEAVRRFSTYEKLRDISNTEKHAVRKKAHTQAELSTRAVFLVTGAGNFRFARNQVLATCPAWGEVDAIEALGSFVNEGIRHFKFNDEKTIDVQIAARPEQAFATLRATPQSLPMEGIQLSFIEPAPEGGFRPVDPAEIRFQVIPDPGLEGLISQLGS